MNEPYLSLISGFVGAIIGATASLAAVWIQGRHWLNQQTWTNRERQYMDLLASLTKLKLSLEDRREYYREPGSEHDASIPQDAHFSELSKIANDALRRLREQLGPASVFLSTEAVLALEKLIRDHWNVSDGSICTADYLDSALPVVTGAYSAVLTEAKHQLTNGGS
jgi:hypothetical protein